VHASNACNPCCIRCVRGSWVWLNSRRPTFGGGQPPYVSPRQRNMKSAPDNRCILCAGARLPLAPCEISAIQKQSALANGQFRIRIRGRFDSPLSRRLRANYTGIGHLRSTPASSCCSATSCTILRPFSHPSIVQTGGVVLEERPSTLSIWPTSAVQC